MRLFPILAASLLLLSACGGGGGGGSSSTTSAGSSTTPTSTAVAANVVPVTVDGGPSSLQTGANATYEANTPYISVTICAPSSPGTCQTIDHVAVDTGSVGLRLIQPVLSANLLSALASETDPSGNPVGECYQYVDGYLFGSVRLANVQLGGETVASMPVQVAGDTGAFSNVPSSCSSGGGSSLATVSGLGANAIIGIGTTATDCGANCASAGGQGAAFYYDCPSSGCSSIIARAPNTTAPFQQLPNPVAALPVDNNGSILSLPAVSSPLLSLAGTLYLGIGTETNNGLGSAKIYTVSTSTSMLGPGLFTVSFNGQSLADSFIDSGSSAYFFDDSSIPLCTQTADKGYYCPATTQTLALTVQGMNGVSSALSLALGNAQTLLDNSDTVIPDLGASPNSLGFSNPYPTSFDLGVPFFFGRNVYTAIEGRQAGSTVGPYYAF